MCTLKMRPSGLGLTLQKRVLLVRPSCDDQEPLHITFTTQRRLERAIESDNGGRQWFICTPPSNYTLPTTTSPHMRPHTNLTTCASTDPHTEATTPPTIRQHIHRYHHTRTETHTLQHALTLRPPQCLAYKRTTHPSGLGLTL